MPSIPKSATVEEEITLKVSLNRKSKYSKVHCPYFPKSVNENWWLIVSYGEELLALKKVNLQYSTTQKVTFNAPDTAGKHKLTVHLLCGTYAGLDHEIEFELNVVE